MVGETRTSERRTGVQNALGGWLGLRLTWLDSAAASSAPPSPPGTFQSAILGTLESSLLIQANPTVKDHLGGVRKCWSAGVMKTMPTPAKAGGLSD